MGTDKDSKAWQNQDEDEVLARKMQDEEDALLARQLQDQDINDHHPQSQSQPQSQFHDANRTKTKMNGDDLPDYARFTDLPPPPAPAGSSGFGNDSTVTAGEGGGGGGGGGGRGYHSNQVMEAGKLRAKDEQQMQNWLQTIQYQTGIYNSELEPEHEADWYCNCAIHQYQRAKIARAGIQDRWNKAVLYPGEKSYIVQPMYSSNLFSGNPYLLRTVSPYLGSFPNSYAPKQPSAKFHQTWITQTISLNNSLNAEAQKNVDGREPKHNIWGEGQKAMVFEQRVPSSGNGLYEKKGNGGFSDQKRIEAMSNGSSNGHGDRGEGSSIPTPRNHDLPETSTKSKFSNFRKSIGIKTGEERQLAKLDKAIETGANLRSQILEEEFGRWPDDQWRAIVRTYQDKIGMSSKIAQLRANSPIQYLHLLRAGYFEPIPVAWATQASNPLKFSIEAAGGWRGITPAWRGYEDTAEERLYWVLNHREGSTGTRLKPDFISALDLARQRMASAVPPPPEYYDVNDTCHNQHKTDGYSDQVRPTPFKPFDRPEVATDDTMILLDVSGSMDFTPQRPRYDRYLIRGFDTSNQPKNRDLASAIIRRFVTAMENHDHSFGGYDLTTFSSNAKYIGTINEGNFEKMWSKIKFGGQTRVMTGWQKIKELHFEKHSESAIHHPLYGWQAGPETPILRLLLLLDGEASDMDEFELDLLGLSWAHVTIFLIGVDGCPHHHRHANELQRISDVNHHVSFVDAQGNTPERFVTHELLKRHLGYDLSLDEFKGIELPPSYQEATRS